MKTKIKIIFFDFAGTLAYFKESRQKKLFEPLKDSLKKFGFNIRGEKEMDEFRSALFNICGKSKSWEDLSYQLSKKFIKNHRAKNINGLAEFMRKTFVIIPYKDVGGIVDLPIKKAVLSNAPRFLVEELGLKGFRIFTPRDTKFVKPDERAFLYALKKMKVKPENALMVGDVLEKDIAPALRLGMSAVLLDREDKIETLCKKINHLGQLKKILGL